MRHVDGRLSDRASATWPGALVTADNVACDCEFDPRYDKDDGGEGESWHYHRTCRRCGTEWAALHCPHDGIQNQCPGCNAIPAVVLNQWYLERPGADPVDLGGYYMAAVRGLGALIRAEKAKRSTS